MSSSIYMTGDNSNVSMVSVQFDNLTTLPPCELSNTTEPNNETGSLYILVVTNYFVVVCDCLICFCGLVGNGLVIYVVLRFAKMKTITNMYILNLALLDVLFLLMLPFLVTTTILKHWVFKLAMCKIYFVFYSLNLFGGSFNLCVMSADRYLAVCHPIRSLRYRTPRIALFLCLCIWSVSFVVMLPVIMYSSTNEHRTFKGKETCNILWPPDQLIPPDKAFIWYSFILGFAIPVSLIAVFYLLVILRLRHVGPAKKSKEKRKSHRRVTRLVLTVIAVYVISWLPHWCFQVYLVFNDIVNSSPEMVLVFSLITILGFANSMLNPFLYAFLSDNFRKSFGKAFKCMTTIEINRTSVGNENSVFPRTSQTCTRNGNGNSTVAVEDKVELSALDNSCAEHPPLEEQRSLQDQHGFLRPPVQL